MKATINVLLTAWVNGESLLTLLPHALKLYSQLTQHRTLCKLVNIHSHKVLHSNNAFNLMIWNVYKKGKLERIIHGEQTGNL